MSGDVGQSAEIARLTPEVIAALRKANDEAGRRGWKADIGVDDVALLLDAAAALLLADDICSDLFCHHPRSDHGHIGCRLCDCTAMNNEGA